MKDFISIFELSNETFEKILDKASDMKENSQNYSQMLEGKNLGMVFQKSSTRTRVSFEVGMLQTGGNAIFLSSSDIQLKVGESIADTARVLSRYVDGLVARVFDHSDIMELAEYADIPVINGLSDLLHPCQGMTDYFTIKEYKGDLKDLKVIYIGDGNNVTHSLLYGAVFAGCDLTIITPEENEPEKGIFKEVKIKAPGDIVLSHNVEDVKGADVVYTDTWVSMGEESDREFKIRKLSPYQVNEDLMKKANDDAIFMHCLPAHREEEVTNKVADSPQSVIFEQAENRLHVQKAILSFLMTD